MPGRDSFGHHVKLPAQRSYFDASGLQFGPQPAVLVFELVSCPPDECLDLTNRSLLETVEQCAGTECLPKTTFSWQDAGKNTWEVRGMQARGWNLVEPGQAGIAGTEPNASEVSFVVFDADGDGNKEIILKEWPSAAIDAISAICPTLIAGMIQFSASPAACRNGLVHWK